MKNVGIAAPFMLYIATLFVLQGMLHAQFARPTLPSSTPKPLCRVSIQMLPGPREDEVRLVVFLRSCNDFFNFKSASDTESDHSFRAAFSLALDVYDTTGVIRQSTFHYDTLSAHSYEQTRSQAYSIVRSYCTILPLGRYYAKLEVEQVEGVLYRLRTKVLEPSIAKGQSFCPSPLFAVHSDSRDSVFPLFTQYTINFSSDNLRAYFFVDHQDTREPWHFHCVKKSTADDWFNTAPKEFSGECETLANTSLQPAADEAYMQSAYLQLESASSVRTDVLRCDVDGQNMSPGIYTLKLFRARSKDTISTDFECVWSDMPQSLKNSNATWAAMRYILSDKEFDQMTDGSEVETRRNLVTWWKKKDPTPASLFNEAMQAFFSRCDEARTLYMSPAENDGLRTERGKVFILYGAPTTIQQESPVNSPVREIWTYTNKVRKRITFERDSHDVYHVVRVDIL